MKLRIRETAPDVIQASLLELSKIYEVQSDGRVAWEASVYQSKRFTLLTCLHFDAPIDESEKEGLIENALKDCARKSALNISTLRAGLNRALDDLLAEPELPFSVVAQINVPSTDTVPRTLSSMYGSVEVSPSLNSKLRRLINLKEDRERSNLHLHDDFIFLTTKQSARSSRVALNRGFRNLQCCVALINLAVRGYGIRYRFGIPNTPIGKVLMASHGLLVDHQKGSIGDWLAEVHFPTNHKWSFTAHQVDLRELNEYPRRWTRQAKKTDFHGRIAGAIVLFQEGLSAIYEDVALLKFWTCIEVVCSKDQKEPLSKVIERVSSIFKKPSEVRQRLKFIADARHSVVHREQGTGRSWFAVCSVGKFICRRSPRILSFQFS